MESKMSAKDDLLLSLRGSGKALWADEHADEYVRRLREDSDEPLLECDSTRLRDGSQSGSVHHK